MKHIYIDESIHSEDGFILSSFVAAPLDVQQMVTTKIQEVGLTPGYDEYKSGALMKTRDDLRNLRELLLGIVVSKCKLALLVSPSSRRNQLGDEITNAASIFIKNNCLDPSQLEFFIDEGIFKSRPKLLEPLNLSGFHHSEDSKVVVGIQLADLVAHYCSYRLSEKLHGAKKFSFVGSEAGYDPGFNAELGWIFRTQFRFNFFMEHKDWDESKPGDDYFMREVTGYGAFFSNDLDPQLKSNAEEVFGQTWIGCIH